MTNPITKQELIDAAADAATLEKVINDPATEPNPGQANGTVTSRLGQTYNNLAKAMEAVAGTAAPSGLSVPGDYATLGAAYDSLQGKRFEQSTSISVSGVINETATLDINIPAGAKIEINGPTMTDYTITGGGSSTGGSAGGYEVQYTFSSVSGLSVGDYLDFNWLLIKNTASAAHTGKWEEACGIGRVTAIAGTTVTVVMPHYGTSWPTLTLVNARVRKWNAVLKYPADTPGIVVDNSTLIMRNVLVVGTFDPASDTPVDSYFDGIQIGREKETLTPFYRAYGSVAYTDNCGVLNFKSNGVQLLGGHGYHKYINCSGNGHRGYQDGAAGSSHIFAGVACGNHASNIETEGGAASVYVDCVATGSSEQGIFAISGQMTLIRGYVGGNLLNQIDAREGAFISFASGEIDATTGGSTAFYLDNATGELNSVPIAGGSIGVRAIKNSSVDCSGGGSTPTSTTPYSKDASSAILRDNGKLLGADTLQLEEDGGASANFTVNSIGDVAFGLSSANITFKSSGTMFSSNSASDLGRSTDRFRDVFCTEVNTTIVTMENSAGTADMVFGVTSIADLFFQNASNTTIFIFKNNGTAMYPSVDDSMILGRASNRFDEIFSANGTINTSDENEKQDIGEIPDEWLDAWADVKWIRYKWRSSVSEKGGSARWHIGAIAQQVKESFEAHGIDPFEIGLLCYDAWGEETLEDGGANSVAFTAAGERYGLRYNECQAMEAAYQRRRMDRMESALS